MRDLDYYRNLRRPAADVNVGDDVVIATTYRPLLPGFYGHVTNAARVWITVRAAGYGEYRFRRDTQADKDDHYRFATPEQEEYDKRATVAEHVLRDHRVNVQSHGKVPDGHLIALADLLTALDQPAGNDDTKET